MAQTPLRLVVAFSGIVFSPLLIAAQSRAAGMELAYQTVVNNGDLIPGASSFFNAYNQPSINSDGFVLFRARGKGGAEGQPATGIFGRQLATQSLAGGLIRSIALRGELLPHPNNQGAEFVEFPSFPRIESNTMLGSFRAQSSPSWKPSEDAESIGTSAIFANPQGLLSNVVNQLGAVSGFGGFAVPGLSVATKFDQFPGAPSPTENKVVFKGNWTSQDGIARTGVYFREMLTGASVERIADSMTPIPGDSQGRFFGSTAPPSAAMGKAVFLGVDSEEAPTAGGLYLSSLGSSAAEISNLVSIHGLSDLVGGNGLESIGEALSFNGKSVAFWGAWGDEKIQQQVMCASDGNQAIRNYCIDQSPQKDGVYVFQVPRNQGIFVTDIETKDTRLVVKTGEEFDTFLSWNFSGRPPGAGESEEPDSELELARWRSSSFLALDDQLIGFKAEKLGLVSDDVFMQNRDGIYLKSAQMDDSEIQAIVETGMEAGYLDSSAEGMLIGSVGLERDGFRNGRLAFVASMANAAESWAGIYVASDPVSAPIDTVPGPLPLLGLGAGFTRARQIRNRLRSRQSSLAPTQLEAEV